MCVCRYASQKEALLPPCMLPYVMCSSPTCGLSYPSANSWSAISSAVGGVSLLLSPSPVCDPPAVARVCMTGVAVAVARGLAIYCYRMRRGVGARAVCGHDDGPRGCGRCCLCPSLRSPFCSRCLRHRLACGVRRAGACSGAHVRAHHVWLSCSVLLGFSLRDPSRFSVISGDVACQ